MATKIAAWESDVPEHAISENQHEAVCVSLYHTHVPKLVAEGVISCDETTEKITAAEHAEQVLTALEGIGRSLDSNQESQATTLLDRVALVPKVRIR